MQREHISAVKSNQAWTKYSSKCIKQFPYEPRRWTVSLDFRKTTRKQHLPTFHYRTCSIYYLLFFSALELFKDLSRTNKILIGSERPSHKLFLPFQKNAFLWRQLHSSPTFELAPKGSCSRNRPWWSSLNGITASSVLFPKNFFFWWSPHFATFESPNKAKY